MLQSACCTYLGRARCPATDGSACASPASPEAAAGAGRGTVTQMGRKNESDIRDQPVFNELLDRDWRNDTSGGWLKPMGHSNAAAPMHIRASTATNSGTPCAN